MCAGAISHARIGRLVFGADRREGRRGDPRPPLLRPADLPLAAGGGGRGAGEESAALLKGFFQGAAAFGQRPSNHSTGLTLLSKRFHPARSG
jgi:hypothetical protein